LIEENNRRTKQHNRLFSPPSKKTTPLCFLFAHREEEEEVVVKKKKKKTKSTNTRGIHEMHPVVVPIFLAAAKMEKEEKHQRRGRGDKEGDYKKRTGKETLSRREMLEETTEESAQL